jgi:hypothetical protein
MCACVFDLLCFKSDFNNLLKCSNIVDNSEDIRMEAS